MASEKSAFESIHPYEVIHYIAFLKRPLKLGSYISQKARIVSGSQFAMEVYHVCETLLK